MKLRQFVKRHQVLAVMIFYAIVLLLVGFSQNSQSEAVDGTWIAWNSSRTGFPENSVVGGNDGNGILYIIRAEHKNEVIVGKYSVDSKTASIAYEDREVTDVNPFEVKNKKEKYFFENF
jgi:Protein of unknown function (DUF3421)